MPTVRKNSSGNMEIHLFFALSPRFPFDVLEDEKLDLKFVLKEEIRMKNKGESFCKQKISPDDLNSITTLYFTKLWLENSGNVLLYNLEVSLALDSSISKLVS